MLQIVCCRCCWRRWLPALRRRTPMRPATRKQLGDLFCVVGKSGRDGGEFGRMYLVTRALGAAIDEAVKKNDAIAAATPDEKPPLGDGVPFQSFPDEAPVCQAGKFAEAGGKRDRRDRIHLSRNAERQLDRPADAGRRRRQAADRRRAATATAIPATACARRWSSSFEQLRPSSIMANPVLVEVLRGDHRRKPRIAARSPFRRRRQVGAGDRRRRRSRCFRARR